MRADWHLPCNRRDWLYQRNQPILQVSAEQKEYVHCSKEPCAKILAQCSEYIRCNFKQPRFDNQDKLLSQSIQEMDLPIMIDEGKTVSGSTDNVKTEREREEKHYQENIIYISTCIFTQTFTFHIQIVSAIKQICDNIFVFKWRIQSRRDHRLFSDTDC